MNKIGGKYSCEETIFIGLVDLVEAAGKQAKCGEDEHAPCASILYLAAHIYEAAS
jgi:hypothetical protein